jgi:hypothetical protein
MARLLRSRQASFSRRRGENSSDGREIAAGYPNAVVWMHRYYVAMTAGPHKRRKRGLYRMKKWAVVGLILLSGLAPAAGATRISDDAGGQIGAYLAKYHALRASGERVEIDGTCASACTMLLGIIPNDRICVTPNARLVFHSAWDAGGDPAVAADGNRLLWASYPEKIRRWIRRHGGLHSGLITLSGAELAAMFRACR